MDAKVSPIMTQGDRVRMVRQHMGMGQSEFAKALGVTRNYVSYVETGKRNLSEAALNWAGTLSGANIEWLRDGSGKPWADPPEESTFDMLKKARPDMPDNFAQHIAEALDKLDADDWMFLARFAQDMAERADTAKKSAPDESKADDEMVYSETVAKNEQRTPFAVRKGHDTELLKAAKARVKKVPGSDLE